MESEHENEVNFDDTQNNVIDLGFETDEKQYQKETEINTLHSGRSFQANKEQQFSRSSGGENAKDKYRNEGESFAH